MRRTALFAVVLVTLGSLVHAQRPIYQLPRLDGYLTLTCDFHMHTVFSDGDVWPTMRVDEAVLYGIDAIAITDHVEIQQRKDYLPPDPNAAWKIIKDRALMRNIIPIHGAEITRNMPPGHINALFITDAALLQVADPLDAIEAASKQGAFIVYNHPGWKTQQADGIPRWYDMHETMLKRGWMQGVEFGNGREFYPLVLDWARDKHLTVLADTDIHASVTDYYATSKHRPMTLVFAKERTEAGIKEALLAGRTAAWCEDIVAGPEEILTKLVASILRAEPVYFQNDKMSFFEVANLSDIPVSLSGGPAGAPATISIPAHRTALVRLTKPLTELEYTVDNYRCGSAKSVKTTIKVIGRQARTS